MTTSRRTQTAILIGLGVVIGTLAWKFLMGETKMFQPKPLDEMKAVQASDETRKLDAETKIFLRESFSIESARYYLVPGAISWAAVSKSVQNQMSGESIPQTIFEWYEPGIDFVEIYARAGSSHGFALAMPKGTDPSKDKLVGFYVLRPADADGTTLNRR